MEKIFEQTYDELNRNYISFKKENDENERMTIQNDSYPCVEWNDWMYNFSFDEDGNVYCTPNEGKQYFIANLDYDNKQEVMFLMKAFVEE